MLHRFQLLTLSLLAILILSACATEEADTAQIEATSTPRPTAPAVARPTYIVQRGDVQETLEFSGRWQPRDQLPLAFETSGTIRQVNVRRGDTVSAGDLLADYQIGDLENQLASLRLDLEAAQSQLESGAEGELNSVVNAEIALANARLRLAETRASSPWTQVASARQQLDDARRDLDEAQRAYDEARSHPDRDPSVATSAYQALQDAESRVRSAEISYWSAAQSFNNFEFNIASQENAVLEAELRLEQARSGAGNPDAQQSVRSTQLRIDQLLEEIDAASLYAPIDGEVLEVTIQPGDTVEAFNTVIVIGRPQPREIIASLPFGDAQRLSVNLIGVCQIINEPDSAVQCAVRQVPLTARDADQTTRIAADFATEVPANTLIEVAMPLQIRRDVLWLPPVAIRRFQNRTFVVLETPDGPAVADVQIGLETPERVEIISGVEEGDIVQGP
jgi:multidrug efflux pump subunit AcrA (membrane-fusion protein)